MDPAAFKDLSNQDALTTSSQAPYYTAKDGEDAEAPHHHYKAGQGGNSLSGVTGKVGAGGNNYSRPEGQNVRALTVLKDFRHFNRHQGSGRAKVCVFCLAALCALGRQRPGSAHERAHQFMNV